MHVVDLVPCPQQKFQRLSSMKLDLSFRKSRRRGLDYFCAGRRKIKAPPAPCQIPSEPHEARDEYHFVLGCLQYVVHAVAGGDNPILEMSNYDIPGSEKSIMDEKTSLELGPHEQLPPSTAMYISMIHALNAHLLKQTLCHNLPEPDPELLFRIFTPNSNTTHDDAMGFRCSKTAVCRPDLKATTLLECSALNSDAFVDHCEKSLPSEFISLSESPAGLMNFIHGKWHLDLPDEVRIAVINVRMLRKLKVLLDRSTKIEKHFGLRRVLFVTPSHWIAHRWIPVEAIVGYLTLAQFRETCYFMGIISNGSEMIVDKSQLDARLSHDDLFPNRARQSTTPIYCKATRETSEKGKNPPTQ